MNIPQAKLDPSLVEAVKHNLDPSSGFHLIVLSHPRTWEGQMLMSTFIPDWSNDVCFYTPWDQIDAEMVKMHVLWKFTADPSYVLQFKAKCDMTAKLPEQLNINTWRFM